MQKIGILFFLGIGDIVLLLPALYSLKIRLNEKKIFILGAIGLEEILESFLFNNFIDGYSILPDSQILTKNFKKDDLIFVPNYIYIAPWKMCRLHVMDVYARILGSDFDLGYPNFKLKKEDDCFGLNLSRRLGQRIIVLYPFSSTKVNNWVKKRWEKVIRRTKDFIFVQLGRGEVPHIKGAINLVNKTTLMQAFSVVKYSSLVVGVDGLFNHVAQIFKVPAVILWGPHHSSFLGYEHNCINIFNRIECSPCWPVGFNFLPSGCKSNFIKNSTMRCMREIQVDEVVTAIRKTVRPDFKTTNYCKKIEPSEKRKICQACGLKGECNPSNFKIKLKDLKLLRWIN